MKNIILLLLVIFALLSCSKTVESDWTILIYMAADSDYALDLAALADIEDMMQADFSENINIILQVDHSEAYTPSAAYRYHIYPGLQEQISYLGEIDSGDEDELTAFANWGFRLYPSDNQALIIWSHGNGWYPAARDLPPSFCPDIEADNYIGIAGGELRRGIKNINEHLEILIFDACNMQTVEVAAEVADYADYIIGSEDGVNSAGFPYAEIFSSWEQQTTTENICLEIGFQYHKYYNLEEIFPISCSVLKSSEFSQFLDKLEEFTAKWSAQASDEIFMESRQDCIEFNGAGFTNPALDVDIKEFFTKVYEETVIDSLSTISNEIIAAIDSCYIFQNTDEYPPGFISDDVGTAIIWFPDVETQGFFENRKEEYQYLQFSQTAWLDFLENSFAN